MNAQADIADRALHCDDIEEFLQGRRDCAAGVPHKAGKSESYDTGYSAQYEDEQIRSARA